jgi:purine catabolism regulator
VALPTLREVWRLALPSGTRLAAGQQGLERRVLWARRMGTRPPLFGALEAGELALLSLAEAQRVDERLSLAQILAALSELQAVGAGVEGFISQEAVRAAEEQDVPLFALPAGCDLREVERAVIRLIVEREAQLDRRGRQIYRQLAQLSLAQRGLEAIAEALCDLTGKGIFLQDITGLVVGQAWPLDEGRTPPDHLLEQVREVIQSDQALLAWPPGQGLDDRAPPTSDRLLAATSLERCVAAVVVQGQLGGYLSIVGPAGELDDLDRLAVERGALVCAVELAKQRAVALAEDRLRGEFLDILLTMPRPDRTWLEQRAQELGYHLEGPQTVLLLGLDTASNRDRVVRLLRQADHPALLGLHPEEIIVLCSGGISTRGLAEQVCQEIGGLLAGVGGTGLGVGGARTSYRQAQEALALARQVPAWGPVLSFSDLGVLRLLCELRDSPELEAFCQEQLGALLAYDQAHNTELISTLRAFFDHHGNISRAAEALHLHRNSLIYRLERIAEIAGTDLREAENRFALQLALRLLPLLEGSSICAF